MRKANKRDHEVAGLDPGSSHSKLAAAEKESQASLGAQKMWLSVCAHSIEHIEQCCSFVEEIKPIWMSNNNFVKHQEVARFLQSVFDRIGPVRSKIVTPCNATVADMWATYGDGPVYPDKTFRGSVLTLRSDPKNIERIERAANQTPGAILTDRPRICTEYRNSLSSLLTANILRVLSLQERRANSSTIW